MSYTKEEIEILNQMRREQRKKWDEEAEAWQQAGRGTVSSSCIYMIEYRYADDPVWYTASPFFEPLSLEPDQTTDEELAHRTAQMIRDGRHPVRKPWPNDAHNIRPDWRRVVAARVIRRRHESTITEVFE